MCSSDLDASRLAEMLEEAYAPDSWASRATKLTNPFGRGDAGARIVDVIAHHLVDAQASLAAAHS